MTKANDSDKTSKLVVSTIGGSEAPLSEFLKRLEWSK